MVLKKISDSERNQDAGIYVGNLDEQISEEILYELFIQVAPVKTLNIPRDRVTQTHQGYGFLEFMNVEDAEYASNMMNGLTLFGKKIRVRKVNSNQNNGITSGNTNLTASVGEKTNSINDIIDSAKVIDIGANLYIGNLDELIDEAFLTSTFSKFGKLVKSPYIAVDENTKLSKGYAFISYDNFDSSDRAIKEMNGQYLMNKNIKVSYAYKKYGTSRKSVGKPERHGDQAERLLAKQSQVHRSEYL